MLPHEYAVAMVVFLFLCEAGVTLYRSWYMWNLKRKTFPSMVGYSAMVTSTIFTAMAAVLAAYAKSGNVVACSISAFTCLFLYTATKAQIYIFFIERMHIVHKTPSQTRSSSPLYKFNICLLLPYLGVVTLMVIYRVAITRRNGTCRIGLGEAASIPLITYDTFFSLYSVAVFVWPLFHSKALAGSERLLWVAKKNIYGSVVSTLSSFLNIYWVASNETQSADYCLLLCAFDVIINVFVLNYLISGGKSNKAQDDSSDSHSHCESQSTSKVHPMTSVTVTAPMNIVTEEDATCSMKYRSDSVA
mmetsp:Transcript_12829/g.20937  ORF Transcript_12829/g.20937 Transcript_12829/m.20937 type:complete len:303 (+) Transcript_12829:33-941(+)